LFAYDNNTFIIESYLPAEAEVNVSVLGGFGRLRNLVTGEVLDAERQQKVEHPPDQAVEQRRAFKIHLPPHSYHVFVAEP